MNAFEVLKSGSKQAHSPAVPRAVLIAQLEENRDKWKLANPTWKAAVWAFFVVHYEAPPAEGSPRQIAWAAIPKELRKPLVLHCLVCSRDGPIKTTPNFTLAPDKAANTGGMSIHVSTKHADLLSVLEPHKVPSGESTSDISVSVANGLPLTEKQRQSIFELKLAKAIVLGHRPFSFVEDEAMRDVFKTLDSKIKVLASNKRYQVDDS